MTPVFEVSVPEVAARIAPLLLAVPGVLAVSLGGSHARGTATPDSDVDLGVLYGEHPLDVGALNRLCLDLDDEHRAQATAPGGWGPWVDGGAWLTVQGQRVDLIYRDVRRVETSVEDALAGRVMLHAQVGHPHGIHAHHYAAELALGAALLDPGGHLARLRARLGAYPDALKVALERHYGWQADFWLGGAAKNRSRGDVHWLQGCAYQGVMAMAQTLCARHGVWLTNEKGAVAAAARTAGAPNDFERRVQAALSTLDIGALAQLNLELHH